MKLTKADMIYDKQASYEPDMSALIDKEHELIADDLEISLEKALKICKLKDDAIREHQAHILGKFIGLLLSSKNQPAVIYGFALAAGLDQLNGIKSETEVAKKLGVTRALISHYVVAARDVLSGNEGNFDVTKFRKRNETRGTYAKQATSPFIQAKRKALEKHNQATK